MIRINAKAIGIKTPIKVNETIAKVKETFKFQEKVLKRSQPNGKNDIDRVANYYGGQINNIDNMVDYIVDMLGLKAPQIKKLENANFQKVSQLSNDIVAKILHYDDNDKKQSSGKK